MSDEPVSQPGQHPMTLDTSVTTKIFCRYWLSLPRDYGQTSKRWPLILFLHGAGERGNDLGRVNTHGPSKFAARNKDFPFILVSPQCPADQWWVSDDRLTTARPATQTRSDSRPAGRPRASRAAPGTP